MLAEEEVERAKDIDDARRAVLQVVFIPPEIQSQLADAKGFVNQEQIFEAETASRPNHDALVV